MDGHYPRADTISQHQCTRRGHTVCASHARTNAPKAPESAGFAMASTRKAPAPATECQCKGPQGSCNGYEMPGAGP